MASKYLSVSNFRGLVTAAGQLGAPPGAFSLADNVDIPNTTLLEKRRGVKTTQFANYNNLGVAASMFYAQPMGNGAGHLLVNSADDNNAATGSLIVDATTGATIGLPGGSGLGTNAFANRMKGAVSLGNTYLTTSNGIVRVESDGNAWWAGAPRTGSLAVGATYAGPTWFAAGATVAYRAVLVVYDAEGVAMRSAPSGRFVLTNTSGATRGVQWATYLLTSPLVAANAIGSHFIDPTNARRIDIELYRSSQSSTGTPSDEMQLCYSRTLTAAEKNGTQVAGLIDACPDAALGDYLYTNAIAGGDTIVGGYAAGMAGRNDSPPIATDITQFANRQFLSGLTMPHSMSVSLFAPGTSGTALKTGDVITIAGYLFTAGTDFTVYTSGSISENIRNTVMSLVSAVNSYPSNPDIAAEYIGNDSSVGTIGKFRLFRLRNASGSFNVQLTFGGSGSSFTPDLSVAVSSTSESWKNGVAYSKENQANAFPPINYFRVGRGDVAIQRIIPLRDALYIFATDGIWRLTGTTPDTFNVDRFDTSFRLAARDSVVVLDDAIYAWGHEGIAKITSGGVTLIDDAIRDLVTQQYITYPGGVTYNWSVADRVRKRILFFVTNHVNNASNLGNFSVSNSNRALVYNARSGAWTRYDYGVANSKTCGCELGIGSAGSTLTYSPPFVLGNSDDGSGTPTAGNETDGPGYSRTSTGKGKLVVEKFTNTATDWRDETAGGGLAAITSSLEWTCATPDALAVAQWVEAAVLLSPSDTVAANGAPTSLTVGFDTEMSSPASVTATVTLPRQVRVMVPREAARGSHMTVSLTHAVVSEYLGIDGFGLRYILDGSEVSR